MRRRLALLAGLLAAAAPAPARAQLAPPSPGAEALEPRPSGSKLSIQGYLRIRGDVFHNLDLDRGPTPSGSYLFPLPAAQPRGQNLESGDLRFRLEPVWQVTPSVRILAQVDALDNVVRGSTPQGLPRDAATPMIGGTLGQASPLAGKSSWRDAIAVKRIWGEVLLPFGVLAVGRQGALMNWGTGFFVNAGADLDADRADSGDRILFATSLAGHLFMLAFEWSASGPTTETTWPGQPALDAEPRDDVKTVAFGFANLHSEGEIGRRLRAGVVSVNYGLLASYRRQALDVPAYYGPGGLEGAYGPSAYLDRDLQTVTADLWFRVIHRRFRLEVEAAVIWGRTGNASLDAGVALRQPITNLQWGSVVQSSFLAGKGISLGLELGLASGDPAPGFGVRSPLTQAQALPGDLDGPQLRLPRDTRVDNFRFHPNYHVDLILWRRIVGTVTDAAYLRPWLRWQSRWGLSLEAVAIASFALEAASAPGEQSPLGIEIDLGARYRFDAGFEVRLAWGTLIPLPGLDNVALQLPARPAMTLHAVMGFVL